MARVSSSSNNSNPDPRSRRQDDIIDNDNADDNNNNNDHDGPNPSIRIGSPDDIGVDVDIARTAAAPAQQSPVSSTSSEGYPSWLPKRPPPPAPGSTLHSLSTHMMFGSDAADPVDTFPGAGAAGMTTAGGSRASGERQQTPLPFLGGRKPTPRSVRIVSMQDSNAAASGAGGAGTPGGTGGS